MPDDKLLVRRDLRPLRQQVIERLSDRFAHDELDVDEFERRVTLAHTAESSEELERLVDGVSTPAAPEPAASTRMELVPLEQAPPRTMTLSVMGNSIRQGRWAVPRRMTAVAVMGSLVLDFREARFPSGPVELKIRCIMGDVTIIVPPQLAVETSGSNIMGNFEHVDRVPTDPAPDAPVLRVEGITVMGDFRVRMRLPGEDRQASRRQARLPGRCGPMRLPPADDEE